MVLGRARSVFYAAKFKERKCTADLTDSSQKKLEKTVNIGQKCFELWNALKLENPEIVST